MKYLATLSTIAILSACAVHQPDPCLNNNTADCNDRQRPTQPRPCLSFHCGHDHTRTEGCGVCWPWPGSDTSRPQPEPEPETAGEPEETSEEPEGETEPEAETEPDNL